MAGPYPEQYEKDVHAKSGIRVIFDGTTWMAVSLGIGAFLGSGAQQINFSGIVIFLGIGGIGVAIGLGLWLIGAIKLIDELRRRPDQPLGSDAA